MLKDSLLKNKPRETAGSKISRKYDYQKDLSLYLLMQKHKEGANYVLLFDFHDDLAIIDSDIDPSNIDFYQIKSKDKNNWTIGGLTSKPKDKYSIIGKLYSNKLVFPNNTRSLNFISNAKYNFEDLKDGSKTISREKIVGIELSDSDVNEFNTKIKVEHQLSDDPSLEKLITFLVTNLSNLDSSSHCIGILSRMINQINPDNKINPELAYKQIFNEIKRRTEFDTTTVSFENLHDLISNKGISKAIFSQLLENAGLYKSSQEEWSEIKNSLESINTGYKEIMNFKTAWSEMNAKLLDKPNNGTLLKIKEKLKNSMLAVLTDSASNSLNILELVNKIVAQARIKTNVYDDYFIKCIVIKLLNEK